MGHKPRRAFSRERATIRASLYLQETAAQEEFAMAESQVVDQDTSARQRVQPVFERFVDGSIKLPERHSSCRWGIVDNLVVVLQSSVSGAIYMIDRQTGSFFRTLNPSIKKLTGCNVNEVIKEDREWLFPLLSVTIPGGADVIARYRGDQRAAQAPVVEKVETSRTDPSLARLKVETKKKRIVLVEETKFICLGPDQMHALLKLAGVAVPPEAKVDLTPEGYVRVSWGESREKIEEE